MTDSIFRLYYQFINDAYVYQKKLLVEPGFRQPIFLEQDLNEIKDSGKRESFATGSVRDTREGKGRFDLLPWDALEAVGTYFNAGKCPEIPLYKNCITHCIGRHVAGHRDCRYDLTAAAHALVLLNANVAWTEYFTKPYFEVAIHFEQGSVKYGDRNWEKGQPISRYWDSAARHNFKRLAGETDERHDRACAWNILCAIQTKLWIDAGVLPRELDDLPVYKPRVVVLESQNKTDYTAAVKQAFGITEAEVESAKRALTRDARYKGVPVNSAQLDLQDFVVGQEVYYKGIDATDSLDAADFLGPTWTRAVPRKMPNILKEIEEVNRHYAALDALQPEWKKSRWFENLQGTDVVVGIRGDDVHVTWFCGPKHPDSPGVGSQSGSYTIKDYLYNDRWKEVSQARAMELLAGHPKSPFQKPLVYGVCSCGCGLTQISVGDKPVEYWSLIHKKWKPGNVSDETFINSGRVRPYNLPPSPTELSRKIENLD